MTEQEYEAEIIQEVADRGEDIEDSIINRWIERGKEWVGNLDPMLKYASMSLVEDQEEYDIPTTDIDDGSLSENAMLVNIYFGDLTELDTGETSYSYEEDDLINLIRNSTISEIKDNLTQASYKIVDDKIIVFPSPSADSYAVALMEDRRVGLDLTDRHWGYIKRWVYLQLQKRRATKIGKISSFRAGTYSVNASQQSQKLLDDANIGLKELRDEVIATGGVIVG